MNRDPYEALCRRLATAEEVFRGQGRDVEQSDIEEMYIEASRLWSIHRSERTFGFWVRAALLHSIQLVSFGPEDWKSFAWQVRLSPYDDERIVESKDSRELALYALFLTNIALATCFFRESAALKYGKEAAAQALLYYQCFKNRALGRWHATALLVLVRWAVYVKEYTLADEYARKAASLLEAMAPSSELHVYAQHMAGQGDGLVRAGMFKKRQAYFSKDDLFCFQVMV